MKSTTIVLIVICVVVLLAGGCGVRSYNRLVAQDEEVKASWAQVENQYQRRYDLVPNLVETVKGYAAHEKETLQGVTEARARMGGMVKIDSGMVNDPNLMKQYAAAQSGLGSALQRLMVVAERYPELKANQNFRDLQVQLEGTENRIATERRRYNETVRAYNTRIRQFPRSLLANMTGFQRAELFEMEEAATSAPKVEF